MMAYRAAGITIPRTSQQQWTYGTRIPASQARPGDLVFFAGSDGTMTAPGHVGIVTGHDTIRRRDDRRTADVDLERLAVVEVLALG